MRFLVGLSIMTCRGYDELCERESSKDYKNRTMYCFRIYSKNIQSSVTRLFSENQKQAEVKTFNTVTRKHKVFEFRSLSFDYVNYRQRS